MLTNIESIWSDSESLVPFSCYFPTSQATFLLIDFKIDFQHWTEDEAYDEEKINWWVFDSCILL